MRKFKIGDRVRLVRQTDSLGFDGAVIGDIGIVTLIESEAIFPIEVDINNKEGKHYFLEDELELIEER